MNIHLDYINLNWPLQVRCLENRQREKACTSVKSIQVHLNAQVTKPSLLLNAELITAKALPLNRPVCDQGR